MIHNIKSFHICFKVSDTYPHSIIESSFPIILIIKLRLSLVHLTVNSTLKLILQKNLMACKIVCIDVTLIFHVRV